MNKFNMQEHFKAECKDCWSYDNEVRCGFCKELDMFFPKNKIILTKLDKLKQENVKLLECVKFYANKDNWCREGICYEEIESCTHDSGYTAYKTIKELEEK